MIQNKDIGFVEAGDDAEIKVDTFNFTKYGLLRGKVLSVSADSITRERPAGQASPDKTANISGARSSEPQGQELTYAARISLDATRMQIERKLVDLAPGMGGDGGDQDRAAADYRIPALAAVAVRAGEFEGEVKAMRSASRCPTVRPFGVDELRRGEGWLLRGADRHS
jgi:hypothetical protein